MIEFCQKFSRKSWREKESPAGLLTGFFLSLLKEKPLLFLMIQSLLCFQYTVESLKVHLSLLFYFFSIFQIFIILFIHVAVCTVPS